MSGPSVNDFAIKVATVNGTGSASANGLLMKTIFRMGVPVVGKNVFPSNIQGLPTWYEIRVTEEGHAGRSGDVHLMVAMNPQTYEQDLAELNSGGVLLYDSSWPQPGLANRSDVTVLGVPLAQMCNTTFKGARSRILLKNMAYVGAVAALLDLDLDVISQLVDEVFASKAKLIDANMQAVRLGFDFAKEHFDTPLPFRVRPSERTRGQVIIDGNTAAALGCVYAGATFGAWYPITPSTSLMDGFEAYCRELRVDPDTGEHKYCVIQAEDELAAVGLVIGAAWNGARAFTPTSGPGISLMSELIGFAYYGEVPIVIFDVQRTGPSTGMPTRTQQCDLQACAYASHGDTRHILVFPADPAECFTLAPAAFDLAERFQTPVFFMSDLDIGMNDWVVDELAWDDAYQPDRGKVLTKDDLKNMDAFHRYKDVDGDHIPYRTLPGVDAKGAYFLRGSGHDENGAYTENSQAYMKVVDRLRAKWESAAEAVPAPVQVRASGRATQGVIAIGSSDGAVREAQARLGAEGIHLNYMRVRGFPFSREVEAFIAEHDEVFIVEQNRDAQLLNMLLTETKVAREKLIPVLHYSGEPLNYRFVFNALMNAAKLRRIA